MLGFDPLKRNRLFLDSSVDSEILAWAIEFGKFINDRLARLEAENRWLAAMAELGAGSPNSDCEI